MFFLIFVPIARSARCGTSLLRRSDGPAARSRPARRLAAVIVVDASVLVAHLDERDAHHDAATRLLLDAAEVELAASPITVAEVLVGPARAGRLSEAQALLGALGLCQVALGTDAALRLAMLRAQTGLKLPDCCVLLAAHDAPAQAVATFDERLAKVARRVGLRVP